MPFRQASLAVPHRLLVPRHEGRRATRAGFRCVLDLPGREGIPSPPHGSIAVFYRLRSITRATRFACASTLFNDRSELQFQLATDCLS